MSDRQPKPEASSGSASGSPSEQDRCLLCGTPRTASAIETDDGETFCSSGCRDVYAELGGPDGDARVDPDGDADADADADTASGDGADRERTFLRIDGMHSSACEAYLESVATGVEGVDDAEASYVTETVEVVHDPDRIAPADLEDALTTTGYTAYLRERAAKSGAAETSGAEMGTTHRAREMTGVRKRRTDDMLEARYIVGVVFGTFVFLPYIVLLYPVFLDSLVDSAILAVYTRELVTEDVSMLMHVFFGLTGIVLWMSGMPLLRSAYVSAKLRRPTAGLLAALTVVSAYVYSLIAGSIGRVDVYYDLTIVVATLVSGAIYYEAAVKRDALERLTELTISQVGEARLRADDGSTKPVPVEEVRSGDRLLVREGERVPVDGVVAEGECLVDEAVVTGESVPRPKEPGDPVVGGSVVTSDAAIVEVGDDPTSSIERLTREVWTRQSGEHGVQRRSDELAARSFPYVAGAAGLAGLAALVLGRSPSGVVLAILLALIVASPWALAFATRLSVASSVRDATERGLIVFDETIFERLRGIDVVVFDKTGTLTTGEMTVLDADAPRDLLAAASALEARASHPAAAAIASAFSSAGGDEDADRVPGADADLEVATQAEAERGSGVAARADSTPTVADFESHPLGVEGTVDGESVLVGHPDRFRDRGWDVPEAVEARVVEARAASHLPVVVGREGRAEGVVVLGDEPRTDWEETVTSLADRGLEVVILTGDDESAAAFLETHPGVARVFAGVSPDGKVAAVRRLGEDARVAMVGDGTNDAPALAEADLGISLGTGTALASDAADLALVESDLTAVERAFETASAARERVERNLRFGFAYNALAVPLALVGVWNPLVALGAVTVAAGLVSWNSSSGSLSE
ncbi:heavy metal translocating P-type ATPase [Natrialbaceae archaeon GCM10025810]|uniref:heavy metal translocating P-type ATPase n=1 Tax=Halovalidus salilacus TaxID=3075124 RepID=UPI0036245D71